MAARHVAGSSVGLLRCFIGARETWVVLLPGVVFNTCGSFWDGC